MTTATLEKPYTLEALASDIKAALAADPGRGGKEAVCKLVSKVLLDKAFVAKHLTPEQCKPRKVLYEDADGAPQELSVDRVALALGWRPRSSGSSATA